MESSADCWRMTRWMRNISVCEILAIQRFLQVIWIICKPIMSVQYYIGIHTASNYVLIKQPKSPGFIAHIRPDEGREIGAAEKTAVVPHFVCQRARKNQFLQLQHVCRHQNGENKLSARTSRCHIYLPITSFKMQQCKCRLSKLQCPMHQQNTYARSLSPSHIHTHTHAP